MIISLPNGKTIEVSLEVYLRMTDDDFEYLMSINYGEEFINPFIASVLAHGEAKIDEDSEEEEELDLDTLSELDAENYDE
tara:strand:- start:192 stop:431 length:240 start_codon:yes stop_codon:yes gene_type:complete